ncbi:MAG TPA: hypothetical protein VED87_04220 [Methylocystis sp.]|nr:hypothetical protein [Methylocystis sp.]
MRPWRICRALAAAGLTLACATPEARARGDLSLIQDVCVLYLGPESVYFSGYNPDKPRRRFCEDVPATGEAVFAVDFAQPHLREMKIDFRIVRDTGDIDARESLDDITVAYAPPKAYAGGSLSLRHNFTERGNFMGLVTADGPHGEHWVARFPFAVSRPYPARTPYYLLTAAALLALLTYFWGQEKGRSKGKDRDR